MFSPRRPHRHDFLGRRITMNGSIARAFAVAAIERDLFNAVRCAMADFEPLHPAKRAPVGVVSDVDESRQQ